MQENSNLFSYFLKIILKQFAYFKYFSYLCSVINERLQRGCRKPERVGKMKSQSLMNVLKVSLKIWKIEILSFTIRLF